MQVHRGVVKRGAVIEGEGALLSVLHCSRVGRTQVSVTKWDTLFPIRQDPCQQFQNSKTFRTPTRLMIMAGTLRALWAMSAFSYQRRQPDKTLLYRIIHENLATFLERTEQSGGTIPWFVRREFMEFSRCGVRAHGFVRFECRQCRTNRVVSWRGVLMQTPWIINRSFVPLEIISFLCVPTKKNRIVCRPEVMLCVSQASGRTQGKTTSTHRA